MITDEEYIRRRREMFSRVCPPLYLETDTSRLVDPANEVLATKYPQDGRGVLMAGPSRTGKTRTAWMLAWNWFSVRDRSLMAYNGGSFGREVAFRYGEGQAKEWHSRLRDADILVLDDIFKHRMTDAVQDALFSVIEDRMAWLHPTILTINNGFAGIQSAVSADMAEPMIRRISEYCDVYLFKDKPIEKEQREEGKG